MKTLNVNETHQLLNNLQLLNTVSRQFDNLTCSLQKDDPVRIAANAIVEGAEEFKDLQLQIDPSAFEKAQGLFGELVQLQATIDARVNTH
ncbi:hypothetical protein [Vibrio sp. TRT 17S01]|uniref:hypothetical protein n=1 Tax=Vibrio sp. TRT 17S01 TaxID=3418505 RepID=UPI003CEDBCD7